MGDGLNKLSNNTAPHNRIIDSAHPLFHSYDCFLIGAFGQGSRGVAGECFSVPKDRKAAEGATAPETLRPTDRNRLTSTLERVRHSFKRQRAAEGVNFRRYCGGGLVRRSLGEGG